MDAASRPMAQDVFIEISRSRWSAKCAFKTRDSARGLGALARVLCRGSGVAFAVGETLRGVPGDLLWTTAQRAFKAATMRNAIDAR
jgi:hypothetical protein